MEAQGRVEVKIYLASRYSRHPEMRQIRDRLVGLGHEVTSRWIDLHDGRQESSATPERLNATPGYGAESAQADFEDIEKCDMVLSFTGQGGQGGRHVEFGLGLALLKINVLVGPREHVFHSLPSVDVYATFEELETDLPRLQRLSGNSSPWETE